MPLDPQATPFSAHAFEDRFALARWGKQGVLLDVETGAFYGLNDSALELCDCFAAGNTVAETVERLVERYRLPVPQALEAINAFLIQLQHVPAPPSDNPIQFSEQHGTYRMQWHGQSVLEIDAASRRIRRLDASAPPAAAQLVWALPHLLALQGQTVLHASAIRRDSEVIAFSGGSGAGKTTFATTLQRQGFPLVSEDLVLLASDLSQPHVVQAGEAHLRRWAQQHADSFSGQGWLATDNLAEYLAGPVLPLGKLVYLGERQPGTALRAESLGKADALIHLLENSFAELGHPAIWRQVFAAAQAITTTVPAERVQPPEGLPLLQAALADYMRMHT
jgi:hypothetical protein